MNQKQKLSQFIYGKYTESVHEYCLVAYTDDLANQQKQLTTMADKHRFWGGQGVEGEKKAVGIFLYDNKLILSQVSPAVDINGNLLLNGTREFYQHRYIFVPKELSAKLNNQTYLLLSRIYQQMIPYFSDLNILGFPAASEHSWEYSVSDIFEPCPENELIEVKIPQIQQCWSETDSQGKFLLLQGLSVLANRKRLLLSLDEERNTDPAHFLESILLLLPAGCRIQVAIAAGTVDEHKCIWADIIVKTNGIPKGCLPDNMFWLNTSSMESGNGYDKNTFEQHQYVSDFITPINNQSDNILRLVQHLNTLENFTFDNLITYNSLIEIIPGLPEEQQINLLCKYIPNITRNLEDVIEKFPQIQIMWEALKQLFNKQIEFSKQMLFILRNLSEEKVIKIIQHDFRNNLRLAKTLLEEGLLDQYCDKSEDDPIGKEIIRVCHIVVEYISEQDVEQSWQLALSLINYKNLFPSKEMQFLMLDATLKVEQDCETLRKRFNQNLVLKLPYIDKEIITTSNLYKHLEVQFPSVAKLINSVFQKKEQKVYEFMYLPKICIEMQMSSDERDIFYYNFLEAFSPEYEDFLFLLTDVVEKSIQNFSIKRSLFSKTYQWFEDFYPPLIKILNSLEQDPNHWDIWEELAKKIYKEPQQYFAFLERNNTCNLFSQNELLIFGMQLVNKKINNKFKNSFIKSDTWLSSQPQAISKILATEPNFAEDITNLSLESGRLDLISGDLLYYLCKTWVNRKCISENIWAKLISPSTFKFLTNDDWLTLWEVTLLISEGSKFDLPMPKSDFNETEQLNFVRKATSLLSEWKKITVESNKIQVREKAQRFSNDLFNFKITHDQRQILVEKLIRVLT